MLGVERLIGVIKLIDVFVWLCGVKEWKDRRKNSTHLYLCLYSLNPYEALASLRYVTLTSSYLAHDATMIVSYS